MTAVSLRQHTRPPSPPPAMTTRTLLLLRRRSQTTTTTPFVPLSPPELHTARGFPFDVGTPLPQHLSGIATTPSSLTHLPSRAPTLHHVSPPPGASSARRRPPRVFSVHFWPPQTPLVYVQRIFTAPLISRLSMNLPLLSPTHTQAPVNAVMILESPELRRRRKLVAASSNPPKPPVPPDPPPTFRSPTHLIVPSLSLTDSRSTTPTDSRSTTPQQLRLLSSASHSAHLPWFDLSTSLVSNQFSLRQQLLLHAATIRPTYDYDFTISTFTPPRREPHERPKLAPPRLWLLASPLIPAVDNTPAVDSALDSAPTSTPNLYMGQHHTMSSSIFYNKAPVITEFEVVGKTLFKAQALQARVGKVQVKLIAPTSLAPDLTTNNFSFHIAASWLNSSHTCKLDWYFVDPFGNDVSQGSTTHQSTSSALMVVGIAFKAVVETASCLEIHHLRVFSDSHSLVSLIISNGDVNELKSVLHGILCLLETFSSIFVSFISCTTNVRAYSPAKTALISVVTPAF